MPERRQKMLTAGQIIEVTGFSEYEQEEMAGLVWLLLDHFTPGRHTYCGVYSDPVEAIQQTTVDPEFWHHLYEHYWEDTGRWELIPYVIDEPKPWAEDDFKKARVKKYWEPYGVYDKMREGRANATDDRPVEEYGRPGAKVRRDSWWYRFARDHGLDPVTGRRVKKIARPGGGMALGSGAETEAEGSEKGE